MFNKKEYNELWRKENTEKIKKNAKIYRLKNKEKSKQYYIDNKEKFNTRSRQYYQNNKQELLKYHKTYNIINYDKVRERNKKWINNNPESQFRSHWRYIKKIGNILNLSSKEYKYTLLFWSKSIKERDNYICQICNSKQNLISHHILHKLKYPQLSLNINNGITLCRFCHHEVHFGTNDMKF